MPDIYVTEEAFEGAEELHVCRSRRVGKHSLVGNKLVTLERERAEGKERPREVRTRKSEM